MPPKWWNELYSASSVDSLPPCLPEAAAKPE